MSIFNSQYSANQIEGALTVIIDSGITTDQLKVLVGVTSGTAVANKAVILDGDKSFVGMAVIGASEYQGVRLLMDIITTKPANPPSGKHVIYAKADGIYFEDSAGIETKLAAGGILTKIETITSAKIKEIQHDFNQQYVNVQFINDQDEEETASVKFVDVNNVTVEFTDNVTGTIIVRRI